MSANVSVVVLVEREDDLRAEVTTLLITGKEPDDVGRIVAGAAKLLAQQAWYGSLRPTPAREGGRG